MLARIRWLGRMRRDWPWYGMEFRLGSMHSDWRRDRCMQEYDTDGSRTGTSPQMRPVIWRFRKVSHDQPVCPYVHAVAQATPQIPEQHIHNPRSLRDKNQAPHHQPCYDTNDSASITSASAKGTIRLTTIEN